MDEGKEPRLPGASLQYLVDYLFLAGPTMPTGFGAMPLTYGELAHWQRGAGLRLQPWELRMLRRLSTEYVAQSSLSEAPDCKPPFDSLSVLDRTEIARKIDDLFR